MSARLLAIVRQERERRTGLLKQERKRRLCAVIDSLGDIAITDDHLVMAINAVTGQRFRELAAVPDATLDQVIADLEAIP